MKTMTIRKHPRTVTAIVTTMILGIGATVAAVNVAGEPTSLNARATGQQTHVYALAKVNDLSDRFHVSVPVAEQAVVLLDRFHTSDQEAVRRATVDTYLNKVYDVVQRAYGDRRVGGVWADNSSGEIIVNVPGGVDVDLAAIRRQAGTSDVQTRAVRYSSYQLDAIRGAVRARFAGHFASFGTTVSNQQNQVVVFVPDAVVARAYDLAASLNQENPESVTVVADSVAGMHTINMQITG